MENMYFKCPVCDKRLHTCNKRNRFPINYKIRCKQCKSVFGFIPKIFVKSSVDETNVGEIDIAELLKEVKDIEEIKDDNENEWGDLV